MAKETPEKKVPIRGLKRQLVYTGNNHDNVSIHKGVEYPDCSPALAKLCVDAGAAEFMNEKDAQTVQPAPEPKPSKKRK